jgi:DNA-binding CsgD family transcriptional regulator/Flp pilus assembly protein TadD
MGPARDIGYVDPFLLGGDRPSRASDMFSLGATIHFALAGGGLYGPLPADDPIMAMRRVASRPPVISAELDPGAREVIAWAVAADPAERPATALELAERIEELAAEAMQTSPGELAAARWLDAEDGAAQQALPWALERDPGLALRLATALAPWWVLRGRTTSGYPFLRAAAEQVGPDGDAWPTAQYWLGYAASLLGDFLGALKHYALAINAVADDPRSPALIDARAGRANCLLNLGRTAEAAEEAGQALELAQQVDYPPGEARALLNLSIAAQYAGEEEKALDWARQATRLDQRAIPGRLARQCNHNLADILVDVGDLAVAEDICVTELDRARQAGDLISQSFCLDMLADLDQRSGRIPEAAQHLREALEISTRIGNRLRQIDCLDNCGHLCTATRRWADAVTMWAAYIACLKEIGMTDLPAAAGRRREPLHAAGQALGPDRTRAAEQRGQDLTLVTAVELAILLAGTDSRAPQVLPELGKLSAKERDLVVLVAQGRTNAEIAGQLHISASTVRHRLDRIRDKAGCPRRADLIRLALRAGLV